MIAEVARAAAPAARADPRHRCAAPPTIPARSRAAARALAAAPLEPRRSTLALGRRRAARVLVRFAGAAAGAQAQAAVAVLAGGRARTAEDGRRRRRVGRAARRPARRAGRRGAARVGRADAACATCCDAGAGRAAPASSRRAGLGLVVAAPAGREPDALVAAVERLRAALAPAPCVVLDAPDGVRARAGPLGEPADGARAGAHAPRQGALRPGRRLQPGPLRRRDLVDVAATVRRRLRRHRPPDAGAASTTACTAASACRPARPTCCGARRWTRRAGAST